MAIQADIAREVPAFVGATEEVVGFAYDPFTDHFFLRLTPGNRIRVVDRPARRIKREFPIGGAHSPSGDMAVRPRDGHLFLIDGSQPELLETTRLGAFVRRLRLAGFSSPAAAVAIDMKSEDLLVLDADRRTVRRIDSAGHLLREFVLSQRVASSLGYDAEDEHLYARLENTNEVGVFDRTGHLLHAIEITAGDTLIDTGPHSFFRMF